MEEFDIDVSGEDIWKKDYTIVVANNKKKPIVLGYKFSNNFGAIFPTRLGDANFGYRYNKSEKGKKILKIRVYCITIYYIFKAIFSRYKKLDKELKLNICRDFDGHENDITSNLKHFLEKELGLHIRECNYRKLQTNSNAHKYAGLLRKDKARQFPNYITLKIEDLEKFLK